MFELDHIFIFTQKEAPEAEALIDLGLEEGPRNIHPGQGTSNRRFFFEQTFLELLWVYDEAEVQSAMIASTRLWERSRSQETGFSPFGLCVRPTIEALAQQENLLIPETWGYKPPYLPPRTQIDVAQNDAYPAEPMLFQTPFGRKSARETQHPLGMRDITKVTLHSPIIGQYSAAMKALLKMNWLTIEAADTFHLTIEFDGGKQQRVKHFSPDLPLTIKR